MQYRPARRTRTFFSDIRFLFFFSTSVEESLRIRIYNISTFRSLSLTHSPQNEQQSVVIFAHKYNRVAFQWFHASRH